MTPGAMTSQAGSITQPITRCGWIESHWRSAKVHGLYSMTVEAAAGLVKVPPGNAVHGPQHGSGRPQQRREGRRTGIRLVGFQCANDVVLRTERTRVVAGRDRRDLFTALDQQLEPALANGAQMRAARDDAHLVARQCQFDRQIAADRTRSVDADLHAPEGRLIRERYPRGQCAAAPSLTPLEQLPAVGGFVIRACRRRNLRCSSCRCIREPPTGPPRGQTRASPDDVPPRARSRWSGSRSC